MHAANDELLVEALDILCSKEEAVAHLTAKEVMPFLLGGLTHPVMELRTVTIKHLGALLQFPSGVKHVLSTELYPTVCGLIMQADLSVATEAMDLIDALAHAPAGADRFFQPDIVNLFTAAPADDITQLRTISVAIRVASTSTASFDMFRQSEHARRLISFLDEHQQVTDVLVFLNYFELLKQLVTSVVPQGAVFLQSAGLTPRIVRLLVKEVALEHAQAAVAASDVRVDSGRLFVLAAVLQFIEELAIAAQRANEYSWLQTDGLISSLAALVPHSDDTVAASAIAALSSIGASVPGLAATFDTISTFPDLITSMSDLRRLAALHGLARVCETVSDVAASDDQRIRLCALLDGRVMARMEEYLKEPFEDIRHGVFKLLRALAKHVFGLRFLLARAGLVEFLLDRRTETTKYGLEWKFDLIKVGFVICGRVRCPCRTFLVSDKTIRLIVPIGDH